MSLIQRAHAEMKRLIVYKNRFQNLIFGDSVHRFEEKLLLLSTLSLALILAVSTGFNFILDLKLSITIASGTGALVLFCLYLFSRFVSRGNAVFLTTSIIILIFVDTIWFVNYGSNGPVMSTFVVYYSFLLLVFDKRHFLLISVILVFNILVLYLFEVNYPEIIGDYTNLTARKADNYIGLVFSFLVIYSFLSAIKMNYIHEYERAKMSDRLKSAFLANMSHEIRTPLNAIVGFSSLIADTEISESDKQMFKEQVITNSDYLLSLIEDIIDVSKIESDQLTVNLKNVDVVPLIMNIVQTFQLAIPNSKNVQVVCGIRMSQLMVTVDQIRLEQILRNLLANAVKFTDEGEIEVNCIQENDFFIFSVKDSGIGIDPEHQQVIFDRFMKIDNHKQHLYRGTGIGLFLSKQLVEIFGGRIWVESEVGKGSIFYFSIPA